MQTYWPGTDIVKSENNHFTLCYDGRPHGYIPGEARRPTVVKAFERKPGGFAKNNGTILGMGPRPHQALTIKKKTGSMA